MDNAEFYNYKALTGGYGPLSDDEAEEYATSVIDNWDSEDTDEFDDSEIWESIA